MKPTVILVVIVLSFQTWQHVGGTYARQIHWSDGKTQFEVEVFDGKELVIYVTTRDDFMQQLTQHRMAYRLVYCARRGKDGKLRMEYKNPWP